MFKFQKLYAYVRTGEHDLALDYLFLFFDAAFQAGKFSSVDKVLRVVDLDQLDGHTAFGLLTASYPARAKLAARDALCDRVAVRLRELGRTQEEIRVLIDHLR